LGGGAEKKKLDLIGGGGLSWGLPKGFLDAAGENIVASKVQELHVRERESWEGN